MHVLRSLVYFKYQVPVKYQAHYSQTRRKYEIESLFRNNAETWRQLVVDALPDAERHHLTPSIGWMERERFPAGVARVTPSGAIIFCPPRETIESLLRNSSRDLASEILLLKSREQYFCDAHCLEYFEVKNKLLELSKCIH